MPTGNPSLRLESSAALGTSAEERFDAVVEKMADEARKAMLIDPCKRIPALDAAIANYFAALDA